MCHMQFEKTLATNCKENLLKLVTVQICTSMNLIRQPCCGKWVILIEIDQSNLAAATLTH